MDRSYRNTLLENLPPEIRVGVRKRVAADEKPPEIKCFYLNREVDESGVSGTGIVAVGVILPSGRALLEWISKRTKAKSLALYEDLDDLQSVHGHEGNTKVVWYGGDENESAE